VRRRLDDRQQGPVPTFLLDRGLAVASLDFRSSNEAPFPAEVFDIKAGIRYLRANAGGYG
jgi:acetyl esterase/lipase